MPYRFPAEAIHRVVITGENAVVLSRRQQVVALLENRVFCRVSGGQRDDVCWDVALCGIKRIVVVKNTMSVP